MGIKHSDLPVWKQGFDSRQLRLIGNCQRYASGDPAGLPGHQLMLIVAKMADKLRDFEAALKLSKELPLSPEGTTD